MRSCFHQGLGPESTPLTLCTDSRFSSHFFLTLWERGVLFYIYLNLSGNNVWILMKKSSAFAIEIVILSAWFRCPSSWLLQILWAFFFFFFILLALIFEWNRAVSDFGLGLIELQGHCGVLAEVCAQISVPVLLWVCKSVDHSYKVLFNTEQQH